MVCTTRTVTQYDRFFTPGAVGGRFPVCPSLDSIVTFCLELVQSNPFFRAYWHPLFRLLVEATAAHDDRLSQSTPVAPELELPQLNPLAEPPPARIRAIASWTADSAAPSAAACASFWTKNDQPMSTANPM